MGVSKNNGTPNHPMFNRVFHEINHPFWGFPPIFGNIQIFNQVSKCGGVYVPARDITGAGTIDTGADAAGAAGVPQPLVAGKITSESLDSSAASFLRSWLFNQPPRATYPPQK